LYNVGLLIIIVDISCFVKSIGVSRQTINELIRERREVSPEMALQLQRLFGNSSEFWLNGQQAVDFWDASHTIKKEIDHIHL